MSARLAKLKKLDGAFASLFFRSFYSKSQGLLKNKQIILLNFLIKLFGSRIIFSFSNSIYNKNVFLFKEGKYSSIHFWYFIFKVKKYLCKMTVSINLIDGPFQRCSAHKGGGNRNNGLVTPTRFHRLLKKNFFFTISTFSSFI